MLLWNRKWTWSSRKIETHRPLPCTINCGLCPLPVSFVLPNVRTSCHPPIRLRLVSSNRVGVPYKVVENAKGRGYWQRVTGLRKILKWDTILHSLSQTTVCIKRYHNLYYQFRIHFMLVKHSLFWPLFPYLKYQTRVGKLLNELHLLGSNKSSDFEAHIRSLTEYSHTILFVNQYPRSSPACAYGRNNTRHLFSMCLFIPFEETFFRKNHL